MTHLSVYYKQGETMRECERCGSYAINEQSHGRIKGVAIHLCDVCYWRAIAEALEIKLQQQGEVK